MRLRKPKAVRLAPSQPIELYDLESDIGEQRNAADSHPDVIARIKEILSRVRTEEDTWPLKDKKGVMPF